MPSEINPSRPATFLCIAFARGAHGLYERIDGLAGASMRLGQLRPLRNVLVASRILIYRRIFKLDIHPSVRMSLSAKFDLTFPSGIHVGEDTYLAFNSRVLSHDRTRGLYLHTRIGRNCFIGGQSLILPGVEIGDGCVIGAGSVVTKSVPAGCVAAGNPAVVLREGIQVGKYGRFADADDNEDRLRQSDPALSKMPSKERPTG